MLCENERNKNFLKNRSFAADSAASLLRNEKLSILLLVVVASSNNNITQKKKNQILTISKLEPIKKEKGLSFYCERLRNSRSSEQGNALQLEKSPRLECGAELSKAGNLSLSFSFSFRSFYFLLLNFEKHFARFIKQSSSQPLPLT